MVAKTHSFPIYVCNIKFKMGKTMRPLKRKVNFTFEAIKKLVTVILVLAIIYVLPLSGNPQLLFNWKIIVLIFFCSIVFLTQPRVSLKESQTQKALDRNTVWLIILISLLGQVAAIIDWSYFQEHDSVLRFDKINYLLPLGVNYPLEVTSREFIDFNWLSLAGLALMMAGTIIRLYAIKVLGKYFTATVKIQNSHRIIENGPYKYLRHPSYTGAYLAMIGSSLILESLIGFIILGIGMLVVYHIRISAEEKALENKFKHEYTLYCSRTWRMLPLVY